MGDAAQRGSETSPRRGWLARQVAQEDVHMAALQKQLETLREKDDQIDAMAERMNALEPRA
jgi:hypothetical protein